VVFSEACGPYGDIQKTWTNTCDPKLKFSGKEREGYSELDYFGARYYDHKSYRFNSVDPIINKTEALYNPQLWNLYAYCRRMDSSNAEKMKRDKATLEKALALTAGVALAFSLIDDNKDGKKGDDKNKSKGGKKASDSSKGMPHGDDGRAMEKGNKQIAELEEKLKTAKGKEAKRIRWKIQRIRKDAQKKKKGGTDWRK
jgi:RHS repeat-associated protein